MSPLGPELSPAQRGTSFLRSARNFLPLNVGLLSSARPGTPFFPLKGARRRSFAADDAAPG
ncbi:hypothetical protein HMPREF0972_01433 [Actinomyces sp. oral taxon 848 str. F0332]|nr:hypothetical protein HMPREF0972_01433 [Actinomyces sp. oral taxon 848 str. F0332]